MPAKSLAFARIRSDALGALAAVPAGRVTTYGEVGRLLAVMPRHIAYFIATLTDAERRTVPWQRIAADGGVFSPKQWATYGAELKRRLRREGVTVSSDGRIADWDRVAWTWPHRAERPSAKPRGPYADPRTPLLFPPS
jgi:methylated-DNA-protein-cysteine methyltransferase-like protein